MVLPRLSVPAVRSFRRPRICLTYPSRPFGQTTFSAYPKKGFEDRNSINAQSTEYSKSGTDSEVAENDEAAFDPSITSPEQEKKVAGEGNTNNPLEVSPGNPEVSKVKGETEAEKAAKNPERKDKSGPGSPKKAGEVFKR